jgi:hypothetical protein
MLLSNFFSMSYGVARFALENFVSMGSVAGRIPAGKLLRVRGVTVRFTLEKFISISFVAGSIPFGDLLPVRLVVGATPALLAAVAV